MVVHDVAPHMFDPFESYLKGDQRPRQAIEAQKQWIHGNISIANLRKYAFSAHRAARETVNPVTKAVARCCGHACATAHVKSHAKGAAMYAVLVVMHIQSIQ